MYKSFAYSIAFLLTLNLNLGFADPPAVHPATGEPLVIDCLRGTPAAIDGDLSDWNLGLLTPAVLDVREQIHTGDTSWDGPADCSGEFYLTWDDKNIYMAVVVKDDKLSMTKTAGSIWNADAIEIFFSTTNAVPPHAEHYQYGFNANNQIWNWCNMDGNGSREPDYLQVASTITSEGYICEAAIEHGRMLSLDFSAGNTIGFHPVIDDTEAIDREIQMTWTGREAHDQSLGFGHIFLSSAVAMAQELSHDPSPANGAMNETTWTTLAWLPGDYAVSHDLYISDNFDDVNGGIGDTFQGNYKETSILAGFPGYPVPGGLKPGTTYYWRVDEVNDANPSSPWKGNVWSFSIKPYTSYNPSPADGVEFVATDAELTWSAGYGAKVHYFYIGESFDDVNNSTTGQMVGKTSHSPTGLQSERVYYWRVDEFEGPLTHKGDIWCFTTVGAAGNPQPANREDAAPLNATLTWTPAETAVSHDLYFGTDADAVRNATKASPEYKGSKAKGAESHNPGRLAWDTEYFWRVDAVYAGNTVKGLVWSFKSADFISVDDFESYNDIDPPDPASNTIYSSWADGYGIPTNGALTANELPPYAEQVVVHSGGQSMKYLYDTNLKICESTVTLVFPRNWTEEGVTKLSLWFTGASLNSAERMFIALNGSAVVYHDDPAASQITGWNEWIIDLQKFADQGVNLPNVNTMTIGFGTKNAVAAGGTGKVYFDDIRLIR